MYANQKKRGGRLSTYVLNCCTEQNNKIYDVQHNFIYET